MYIHNQIGHFLHPLTYMRGALVHHDGYDLNNGKLSTCADNFEIHNSEPSQWKEVIIISNNHLKRTCNLFTNNLLAFYPSKAASLPVFELNYTICCSSKYPLPAHLILINT